MQLVLQIGIPIVLVGMMFLVGLDLQWSDFAAVRRRLGLVAAATIGQFVAIPGLAILVARGGGLTPELEIGMLLLAACPGGAISNTYTSLARGDVALSVVLTALSCGLAFVTLPAACVAGGWLLGYPLAVQVPVGAIGGQLIVLVLLPIACGLGVRRRWPAWVAAHRVLLQCLSVLAVATLLVLVVVPEFERFIALLPRVAPLLVGLTVLCGAVGWGFGAVAVAPAAVRGTLAIEFAVRNLGVGALVGLGAFARSEYAVLAALCFLVQVPLLLLAVFAFRHWTAAGRG